MTTHWSLNDMGNMVFDIGIWGYFIWCIWSLHEALLIGGEVPSPRAAPSTPATHQREHKSIFKNDKPLPTPSAAADVLVRRARGQEALLAGFGQSASLERSGLLAESGHSSRDTAHVPPSSYLPGRVRVPPVANACLPAPPCVRPGAARGAHAAGAGRVLLHRPPMKAARGSGRLAGGRRAPPARRSWGL